MKTTVYFIYYCYPWNVISDDLDDSLHARLPVQDYFNVLGHQVCDMTLAMKMLNQQVAKYE